NYRQPTTVFEQLDLNLTSVDRALFACGRVRLEEDDRDALISALEEPFEWEQFIEKARWHKLEGLAYHHLRTEPFVGQVPPEALLKLKGFYLRNVARWLHYRTEWHDLIEALKAEGVPAAVMKGGALVERIYKDPGTRPMSDLDLLVPFDRADDAWSVVRSMGYRQTVDEDERRRMIEVDRQLPMLVHPTKAIVVEIHTHLVEINSPMRFDIGVFWPTMQEAEIAGTTALVFQPEFELANQCLNFFKDRLLFSYSALGQLCDVAEVVRTHRDQIDWSLFGPEGPVPSLTGPVFCALYLARQLFGAPVPTIELDRLAPEGFVPDDAKRLVTRRVLGDDWAAKRIIAPDQKYGVLRLTRGMVNRVFESRKSIAERYGVPNDSKRVYLQYFRRIAEAFRVGASMMRKPGSARDDFATDRWLHSLQRPDGTQGETTIEPRNWSRGVR
ncbi:MAG: nucleotidyltransferase family protein, partial [Candidatus Marinimicrobia bacterium]|nr:nucleotidyltransferase family protein [Candidatus Neomarinimicrobiota bacterium]